MSSQQGYKEIWKCVGTTIPCLFRGKEFLCAMATHCPYKKLVVVRN